VIISRSRHLLLLFGLEPSFGAALHFLFIFWLRCFVHLRRCLLALDSLSSFFSVIRRYLKPRSREGPPHPQHRSAPLVEH
jgi:hypothetical protein